MLARSGRLQLPAVLLVAGLVRLFVLLAFPSVFAYTDAGAALHGSVAYDEYARNLLETGVYGRVPGVADAALPPLYSLLVAAVYGLLGRHYLALGCVQIALDLLSIALLYAICRCLFRRRGAAIGTVAGICFALYPYLIFQNLTVNDTALWILLLHLFVWLLILLRAGERYDGRRLALALAAGALLGLSALARALLPALALCALPWFLMRLSWRQSLLRLLPVALMSLLVLLPWTLRSQRIYGSIVPVALNSGENIYQGNNPWAAAVMRAGYDLQWLPPPPHAPTRADDPLARSQFLAQAGWDYLREQPGQIPGLLWQKLQVHWNVQVTPLQNLREGERLHIDEAGAVVILDDAGSHRGLSAANAAYAEDRLFNELGRALHVLYFGGLWLLAVAGLYLSRREWRGLSLLLFVQLSQTGMYLLFHPSTRYRSPTDPLLFVFSAVALLWLLESWRDKRSRLLQ